jgi:AAA+ ATPase superfamily predicted ATPase
LKYNNRISVEMGADMAEFIDRQEEMQTLDNEYARKGSSFVVLYGRRRVGKTTLISEFIKNFNNI